MKFLFLLALLSSNIFAGIELPAISGQLKNYTNYSNESLKITVSLMCKGMMGTHCGRWQSSTKLNADGSFLLRPFSAGGANFLTFSISSQEKVIAEEAWQLADIPANKERLAQFVQNMKEMGLFSIPEGQLTITTDIGMDAQSWIDNFSPGRNLFVALVLDLPTGTMTPSWQYFKGQERPFVFKWQEFHVVIPGKTTTRDSFLMGTVAGRTSMAPFYASKKVLAPLIEGIPHSVTHLELATNL